MAKKKKQDDGGGIPEWVVTYGDMMSLLLCFFILLAAFSELKKEHEYRRVMQAIHEAFGYVGGAGHLIIDDPPMRSVVEELEKIALESMETTKISQSDVEGMEGRDVTVRKIQEGLIFTIGGHLTFDPESAELMEGAKEPLRKVAEMLQGRTNKIVIRGHAALKQLSPASDYVDLDELSYHRARAVHAFLVTQCQLDPRALSIEARGAKEPLAPRRHTDAEQAVNRRVEIVLTEVLLEQLIKDPNYSNVDVARGEIGA
ncbi:MAG: flagellar motor protein MotB [Phycisphaerales bacterium JB038]